MNSADRLKELINLLDIPQKEFAQSVGKTAANLSSYVNNRRKISAAFARKIIEKYPRVNIQWLLLGVGQPFSEMKTLVDETPKNIMRLPVYRNIPCGAPAVIFQDEPLDYETISKIKGLRNPVILEAKGESNLPLIREKDRVIAHEISKPKKGDLVATNFRGADPGTLNANIKIFQPVDKNTFLLKPINTTFDTTIHQYVEVYNFYKCIRLMRDLY